MINISLNVQDIVFIATTIFALIKWIIERSKLPTKYQKWLDKIGIDTVSNIILEASTLSKKSNAEKLKFATQKLQASYKSLTGIDMPEHIANLIVEYVYAKVVKTGK